MSSSRIHVVLPDELLEAVEGVRGDVPRSAWIRRRLEEALSARSASSVPPGPSPVSASPRAAKAPKDPEAYLLPKIAPRKP